MASRKSVRNARVSTVALAAIVAPFLAPMASFAALTPGTGFDNRDEPTVMTDSNGVRLGFCITVPNGTPEVDDPTTPEDETHPEAVCDRAPADGDEGGFQDVEGLVNFPGGGTALLIMGMGFHPAEADDPATPENDATEGGLEIGWRVKSFTNVPAGTYTIHTQFGDILINYAGGTADLRSGEGGLPLSGANFYTEKGKSLTPGTEFGSGEEGVTVEIDQPIVVSRAGGGSEPTYHMEISGVVGSLGTDAYNLDLTDESDTGAYKDDNVTKDTLPEFTFTAGSKDALVVKNTTTDVVVDTVVSKPTHRGVHFTATPAAPLVDGTYRVTAGDKSFTMVVDTMAPAAPMLSAAKKTTTTARLSWTASMDAHSYNVLRGSSLLKSLPAATRTLDVGVSTTRHAYKVNAEDLAGNKSGYSNVKTVALPLKMAKPGLKSGVYGGANNVIVTWSAANGNGLPVTGYRVTLTSSTGAKKVFMAPASARKLNITGLVKNRKYSAQVQAVNAFGLSPLSASSVKAVAH